MQAPSIKCQQNQIICNNAKQTPSWFRAPSTTSARKRSRRYSYSPRAHMGQLRRIARSSSTHRTESLSVMSHEMFAAMSCTVFDWKQQNFLDPILSLSCKVLQQCHDFLLVAWTWASMYLPTAGYYHFSMNSYDEQSSTVFQFNYYSKKWFLKLFV